MKKPSNTEVLSLLTISAVVLTTAAYDLIFNDWFRRFVIAVNYFFNLFSGE